MCLHEKRSLLPLNMTRNRNGIYNKNAWTIVSIFFRAHSARHLFLGYSMNLVFTTQTVDEPKSVVNDFARITESEMISKVSKSARVRFEKLRGIKGGHFNISKFFRYFIFMLKP